MALEAVSGSPVSFTLQAHSRVVLKDGAPIELSVGVERKDAEVAQAMAECNMYNELSSGMWQTIASAVPSSDDAARSNASALRQWFTLHVDVAYLAADSGGALMREFQHVADSTSSRLPCDIALAGVAPAPPPTPPFAPLAGTSALTASDVDAQTLSIALSVSAVGIFLCSMVALRQLAAESAKHRLEAREEADTIATAVRAAQARALEDKDITDKAMSELRASVKEIKDSSVDASRRGLR